MQSWQKRTRVISFRVSEEEYKRFEQLCEQDRARSVSEYARHLALLPLQNQERPDMVRRQAELRLLEQHMDELRRRLEELEASIDRSKI